MRLIDVLIRKQNNFDLLRLLCSLLVIAGHAVPLQDAPPQYTKYVAYSNTSLDRIGVLLFFFLSGLLVTSSLSRTSSLISFVMSRILRIWPALIVNVLLLSLLFGPIVTNLSFSFYFINVNTYTFILNNILFNTQFTLPGVFTHIYYNSTVNGSLWTLKWETLLYFTLVLCKWRFRSHLSLLLIIFLLASSSFFLFSSLVSGVIIAFFVGVVFYLYAHFIKFSFYYIILSIIFIAAGLTSSYYLSLLYLGLFMFSLYFFTSPLVMQIRLPIDISYGIYLWSFPIQQCSQLYFSDYTFFLRLLFSFFISCFFGVLSWYIIEQPFLKLKRFLR